MDISEWQTLNQIDHVIIDRGRHTNIMDVSSYRGAEADTDHQLVIIKVREKLYIANRESKGFKQLKLEVKRLDNNPKVGTGNLKLVRNLSRL